MFLTFIRVFLVCCLCLGATTLFSQNFTDTNLPIVIVDTDGGAEIPKPTRIGADMKIIYRGEGNRTYLTDATNPAYLDYDGRVAINVRGSSSSNFAKKQYRFETQDNLGQNLDAPLLGLPAENDWILGAPYADKTLMRNALAFDMSRELGHYAPRTVFCELVLNGEYMGVYFLTEKIKRDDNRVDVKKMLPTDTQGPEVTGGYILKIDRFKAEEEDGFYTVQGNTRIVFEEPDYNDLAAEQLAYVQNYLNGLETAIFANDFGASYIHYRDYIDLNSVIDMILLKELSKDVDAYILSDFMHKDREGKLRFQPVWDFNLAYGNANYRYGWTTSDWMLDLLGGATPPMFHRMFEDPVFNERFQCRWAELRAGPWHSDSISLKIDNYKAYLDESAARNFQRWDVLGIWLWPNPDGFENRTTYQSEITWMKNWITARLAWMDGQLGLGQCTPPPVPSLVINEIQYNPLDFNGQSGELFEFVELKNTGTTTIELSEITFSTGILFTFPVGSTLAPGAFIVLASDAGRFESKYGFSPYGDFGGNLKNGGEALTITDTYRQVIDHVPYDDILPWPTEANGIGPSLELIDEANDNALGENWHASLQDNGTPGAENSITLFDPCTLNPPLLVINEINYSSMASLNSGDWVEIYNPTASTVDLSGWRFQDEGNLFVIPNGFQIAADGYSVLVANEADFSAIHPGVNNIIGDFAFGLSGGGERIQLLSPERCVVDEVDYDDKSPWPTEADGNGAALSLLDHTSDNSQATSWAASTNAQGTPGQANVNNCGDIPSIVINEINYNSPLNTNAGDWVEIHNLGNTSINLSNWEFHVADSRYTISATNIPADGYIVLAENKALFQAVFPHISNPVGDLGFGLNDDGERISLYNSQRCLVDVVDYQDLAPWPVAADGTGPSLSLLAPALDNQNPASWEASPGNGTPGRENTPCVQIDFSFDEACSTLPTDFSANVNLIGGNYTWNFVGSNPTTASGANVATTWNAAGQYSARLDFTYFECAGTLTKNVNVADCNLPPVAVDDNFQGNEDDIITGTVLQNDSDPEGDGLSLTISPVSSPTNGTLTLNADGSFSYDSYINFNGNDNFTYQVCDDGTPVKCATAEVTISLAPINDALVVTADQASTTEDNAVVFSIIENDYDVDGNLDLATLSFDSQPPASQGIFAANVDGTVTFTPASNFNGQVDAVSYTLCDDGTPLPATCASATISLIVGAVNDAPSPTADSNSTEEDVPVSGNVLLNDTDLENNALSINGTPAIAPANGTVTLQANGDYSYSPSANYNGNDSFAYQVCDDQNPPACAQGLVSISISPTNDAPQLNNDVDATGEDFPVVIDVLLNDNDIDGNLVLGSLTLLSTPPAAQGTVVVNTDGSLTFSPATNFNGAVDPISYSVCDDGAPLPALCSTALVNITVSSQNDLPLAAYDYFSTDEDNAVTGNVAINDFDIDGNNLIVTEMPVQNPASGTVLISTDGNFTYTPATNFNGEDLFIYEICDDGLPSLCTQANVSVSVTPINDAPSLTSDIATTAEDVSLSLPILSNDNNIDGNFDLQTLVLLSTPPGNQGIVTINQDGTLTFAPSTDFNGVVDDFSYEICDNGTPLPALCASATVSITVLSVNDQPVAVNDFYTINEDENATGNILANDSDPADQNNLTTSLLTNPTNGTASIAADGSLDYAPDADFFGAEEFTYEVCDDGTPVLCNQASIFITITAVNDGPIAQGDAATGNEDESLPLAVLDNDFDIDGNFDLNSLAITTAPPASEGEVIVMQDGTLVFYPATNYNGTVVFSYTICDSGGLCDSATVNLDISPVNDAPTAIQDDISTVEAAPVTGNLLQNDNDVDGDALVLNENALTAPTNGSLSLATDGTYTYTPNPGFSGTDSFSYEVCDDTTPALCSQGQANITVVPCPEATMYLPISTCAEQTVTILAADQGPAATYTWDFGPGATPQTSNQRSTDVTFTQAGSQLISLLVERDGCQREQALSMTIGQEAFAEAGEDATLCPGGIIQLGGVPTGPQGASYLWMPDTGLNNNTVANPVAYPSTTTTYTVDVRIGDCLISDQVTVSVDNVTALFADAGPDRVACGEPVHLGGAPTGPIGASYFWEPFGSLNDAYAANPLANPTVPTTYTLTVTKNGCTYTDEVFVDKVNPPVIDAGEDQTICYDPLSNGAILGGPNNFPFYDYTWSPAINLSHPDEGNTFANPSTTTTYTLTATKNGCSVSDIVQVTVDYCNDAPFALNDTLSMIKNEVLYANLMANDADSNGDGISLFPSPIEGTTSGDLNLFEDGNIIYSPHTEFVGTDSFIYEICDDGLPNMCTQATVYIDVAEAPCVEIDLRVMLEGPFDTTTLHMTTKLNVDRHLLPGQTPKNPLVVPTPAGHPYANAPWSYTGIEGSDFDDSSYGANVVDWILVSFRTQTGKETEIARTAALLLEDGTVQFVDQCPLSDINAQELYIVIEHRSHLGIMSANPIEIVGNIINFDFTLGDSYQDITSFGQKEITSGIWCMFAGDGDQTTDFPSYDISGKDKVLYSADNGSFDRYAPADFNLDGDISLLDKILWSKNTGVTSRVPK